MWEKRGGGRVSRLAGGVEAGKDLCPKIPTEICITGCRGGFHINLCDTLYYFNLLNQTCFQGLTLCKSWPTSKITNLLGTDDCKTSSL